MWMNKYRQYFQKIYNKLKGTDRDVFTGDQVGRNIVSFKKGKGNITQTVHLLGTIFSHGLLHVLCYEGTKYVRLTQNKLHCLIDMNMSTVVYKGNTYYQEKSR